MGSMLMNMAANMLGLGNAATPLGLRAMRDLETLNPRPGVGHERDVHVSRDQHELRAVHPDDGDRDPGRGGLDPTDRDRRHGASWRRLCAATVAITSAKLLEKLPFFRVRELRSREADDPGRRHATVSADDRQPGGVDTKPVRRSSSGGTATAQPRAWGSAVLPARLFFVALFVGWFFPRCSICR